MHPIPVRQAPHFETAHWQSVVLAAGAGSRFGGGKLLTPYEGGRLIDAALHAAVMAPVEMLTVVTGFDHEHVGTYADTFLTGHNVQKPRLIVHAPDFLDGLSASLRVAIKTIPPRMDGVFIFLADMPKVPTEVAFKLARSIGEHVAAAPTYRGERGHPVLVKRRLFDAIMQLDGDKGARKVLDGLADDLFLLECQSPGVTFDVDFSQDLEL